jgi:hypothetical protein
MSFVSACKACDVREAISGTRARHEHGFVGLGILALGTWLGLVLALVFIYEVGNDIIQHIIAVGGGIEGNQK